MAGQKGQGDSGRSHEADYGADLEGDPTPMGIKQRCKDVVLRIFPDICHDYLQQVATVHSHDHNAVIETLLSDQEKGKPYRVRSGGNSLKRKRVDDDDSDEDIENVDNIRSNGWQVNTTSEKFAADSIAKYREPERKAARDSSTAYHKLVINLLVTEYKLTCSHFPKVPMKTIRDYVKRNNGLLFNAYMAMDDVARSRSGSDDVTGWKEKKYPSKRLRQFLPGIIDNIDLAQYDLGELEAIDELHAARDLSYIKEEEAAAKAKEKEDFEVAKLAGETSECGCCFEEFITSKLVHCNGENAHRFCRGCMRSQAETTIGYSKYELNCMSMDGCDAGFSRDQTKLFLDKNLRTALDRIEGEAALREAGIEDLETCPFCPYAAECPPVALDKEFRCIRPGCLKVSCRLCRKESHIPETCAEVAIDRGRHELEEAMTDALVRYCNSCKNPFLKSEGCNKISCPKCGTKHCYVCRQTVTSYDHFNNVDRGGRVGQCPLFDNTEERHHAEVQRAEEAARRKVAQDNPTIAADAFSLKVSDGVEQDELRRRQNSQTPFEAAMNAFHEHGGMDILNARLGIQLENLPRFPRPLAAPVVPVAPMRQPAPDVPVAPMGQPALRPQQVHPLPGPFHPRQNQARPGMITRPRLGMQTRASSRDAAHLALPELNNNPLDP
ncbi:hypothetical protein F4818DRAFT_436970 [Hypoxylon cercidicola]|nr:hypothetical protein F4818DRAFT_436970 [Hypoxylon cercidicola]